MLSAPIDQTLYILCSEIQQFWLQCNGGCGASRAMTKKTEPTRPAWATQTAVVESNTEAERVASAPPLAALPTPVTPLFGREEAVRAVVELLHHDRLITLTGPGGTGKTRLAIEIARTILGPKGHPGVSILGSAAHDDAPNSKIKNPNFPAGVYFVSLATIHNPGLVLSAIAQMLGVMEMAGQPLLETLQQWLQARHLLLVLDNFEQVEAAAPLVGALLATAPKVAALITSRTILHLAGEQEFAVLPLEVPTLAQPPSTATIAQNPSVALFVERAQSVRPTLQLTDDNAATIAEICRRLDGLPLALELAAARCRILSPQALLARLVSPLQLLTGGPADLPTRQQTLRATIDWSYHLLAAEEQTLFRRLAIFVGGWTLAAVEEICTTEEQRPPATARPGVLSAAALAVLDRLTALVEHSLVRQEEDEGGEPRFTILETIREYALERLEASGELSLLRRLHVDFYLALAEEAEVKLTSHEQLTWLAQLDREHDNLRAALAACRELAGGSELALRLAAALWWYWWVRGHISEGRAWLEGLLVQTAMDMATQTLMRVRATVLYRAAFLAMTQDDYRRGSALGEESLTLFRALSDAQGIAWARYMLGWAMLMQGEQSRAHADYTESLTLFRALNNVRGMIWALNSLSNLAHMQNDLDRAAELANEHLALARAVGNPREIAAGLGHLSGIVQSQGNLMQAQSYNEEALKRFRIVGDRLSIAITLHSLAYLAQIQQRYGEAEGLFLEAFDYYHRIGSRFGVARCLVGLSAVAEAAGYYILAVKLHGAAMAQHEHLENYLAPDERTMIEESRVAIRRHLGEAIYAAAWDEGRAMTPSQALAASEPESSPISPVVPPVHIPPSPPSSSVAISSASTFAFGLTEREIEVLRLLSQGLSYAEIADKLIISPRTVNRHLTSIYTKLNVASRHAATRFALDHGIA
jgi:predicted ATPase/DNA-binding CsgD family transcriptional regulator